MPLMQMEVQQELAPVQERDLVVTQPGSQVNKKHLTAAAAFTTAARNRTLSSKNNNIPL